MRAGIQYIMHGGGGDQCRPPQSVDPQYATGTTVPQFLPQLYVFTH